MQQVKRAVSGLFRQACRFFKAGVGLVELTPCSFGQGDMFCLGQPFKASKIMQTID
ncbi:hypothetical protein ACJJIR_08415 [Microbulbifer sp. SSSA008]|uniref:hypothetical protein n=1 Tax=Microbulbifer sp. SSSA008 TaxID=3243380 RepID=UPI00403A581F